MVSLSLDIYHHPQTFSEEVVTLTLCTLKDAPRGGLAHRCAP